MKISYFINAGQPLDPSELEKWERRTSKISAMKLYRRFGDKRAQKLIYQTNDLDLEVIRSILTDIRMCQTDAMINYELKPAYALSDAMTLAAVKMSNGKTVKIHSQILIEDLPEGFDLADLFADFMDLMLTNNEENRRICLEGAPDHMIVKSVGKNEQIIVESAGGLPFESRFFNHYGDLSAITTERLKDYPFIMVGTTYLKNGVSAGGVCHQYKPEGTGFRVDFSDEFPASFPPAMIYQHQMHALNEYGIWYKELLKKRYSVC